MKIAVQGCGHWGKNWVRVLEETLGPANVVKVDPAIGGYLSVVPYDKVDAVVIATPAESHYKLAMEALLAGKHVMVEKPMSLSLRHAEDLIQVARNEERVLMTDHLMLVHPAYTQLKALVREGVIGDVVSIEANRYGVTPRPSGVVWTMAPHDLSMLIDLLGKPVKARTKGLSREWTEITGEGVAFIDLFWHGDLRAYLDYDEKRLRKRYMLITGTEGRIELLENELYVNGHKHALSQREPVKLMAEAFIRSINCGEAEVASGESALPVIKILEEVTR